jgi:hypothetical protein
VLAVAGLRSKWRIKVKRKAEREQPWEGYPFEKVLKRALKPGLSETGVMAKTESDWARACGRADEGGWLGQDWSGMGCAEAERSMRRLRMRDGMGGGATLVECCCTDTGRERMGQSAKECGEVNHGAPLGNCF